jgi:hypothetical protein
MVLTRSQSRQLTTPPTSNSNQHPPTPVKPTTEQVIIPSLQPVNLFETEFKEDVNNPQFKTLQHLRVKCLTTEEVYAIYNKTLTQFPQREGGHFITKNEFNDLHDFIVMNKELIKKDSPLYKCIKVNLYVRYFLIKNEYSKCQFKEIFGYEMDVNELINHINKHI